MSVILYARVSAGEQAERDLSVPAQFRALWHLAAERGWAVAAEFQDVGTCRRLVAERGAGCPVRGRLRSYVVRLRLKEWPGIMAAIRMASENKLVEAILVHRVDRPERP